MTSKLHLPSFRDFWDGFVHLLYPDLCVACQHDLPVRDSCFCLRCRLKNVCFSFDSLQDNACTTRLWGRLPVEWAASGYHFTRKSPIQKALHQLKYHNKPEIGLVLGRELGLRLKQMSLGNTLHGIVPVPLHPKKERLRGYNQSMVFAQGVAETLGVPIVHGALKRQSFTKTQTDKRRMERFQNVDTVFALDRPHLLTNKHLLLVDDVLTTGATLEMCGQLLLQEPGVRLSVATIAIADR
jgi:ComF family protein